MWVVFPESVDTFEMLKFMVDKHKISFFPGIW